MSLDTYKRKALIDRIEKEAATVGHDIPDAIRIDDTEIELSQVASEIRTNGVSETQFEEVIEFKRMLRRKQNDNKKQIQNAELTTQQAESLAEETIGIKRVLNMFTGEDVDSLDAELKRNRARRQKRWQEFLRQNNLR